MREAIGKWGAGRNYRELEMRGNHRIAMQKRGVKRKKLEGKEKPQRGGRR